MSSVDDYISKIFNINCLNKDDICEVVDTLDSPWLDRINIMSNNLSSHSGDSLFLLRELKIRHLIRDAALINFSKDFIESAFNESKIILVDKLNYSKKPKVVLGVHDYFQVFTAYKLSLLFGGVYAFVEDSALVPSNLSRIFEDTYQLYNKISNGGVIVETGGLKKPYALMNQCIADRKSVFATIDIFSDALKNVIDVEGELGHYTIVSGVIEYFIKHDYEFCFARTILNNAGVVSLHLDEISGVSVSDISKGYIRRLEYYNKLDPLGWEGYLSRKF